MVRSKDVPDKPRDPLLTPPPSKRRGVGLLDEGGRSPSSTATSPAPASVPNYMRGTSSSDAKGGRRRARRGATLAPASASPARRRTAPVRGVVVTRGKVLFPETAPGSGRGPGLGRATCSSTLKGARFPDALDLAPGATDADGPAAMRVCRYTYCSLNGHAHAPAAPLRGFLASRRRLIKTQQSMKLKGVSAFRKKSADKDGAGAGGAKIAPLIEEEALGDFFVEVYAGPRVSSGSDMSLDEMDATVSKMEFVAFDRCGADEVPVVCGDGECDGTLGEKHGACRDTSSVCSDAVISGDFIEELPWMRYLGYQYDSFDDGISEEQRTRDDGIDRGQISEEQGGNSNKGISDKLGDGCEHEANDEENISNLVFESEIAGEQEDVGGRVEACQELDRRDEDNIQDALCHGEPSAGKATAEDKFSDAVDKSEIPEQEVAGRVDSCILEESCKEEALEDQEAKYDEFTVKSDGGSEVAPDDGSEMEISEDALSSDGYFSEEVTSKAVLVDNAFEQHDSIADESTENVLEQDGSPENAQSSAQMESGIPTSKDENASEGSGIAYNIVDSMNNAQKEMEVTTYENEESCEESDTAHGSNSDSTCMCFGDGAQMELKDTTCMSKDASVESDISQGSSLDGNTDYATDGTEMGPQITICKLEDSYGEPQIDQGTVEDDDSLCLKDDAQNDDSGMTECKLGDASKDSFTTRGAEQSDTPANVRSGAQNESNHTTNELALGICEDTENESKLTRCQPEDVSEESNICQESDHDDSSADITDDTQNESVLTTFELEDAQEDSDVVKDDEGEGNGADSQKKLESSACEPGGASVRPAMSQEADNAQTDTLQKLDASEDILTSEETNESFNLEIPELKSECMAEGHVESKNITAEVTDAKETSVDDICNALRGMNLKGDVYFDPDESATCPRNKLIISRRRRTPEEDEYMRGFNPRAPNFLPLELDPDAEKVDLRHQMVDERKNAEEWMIDYALRRAVTNLAPARKKKVELLVQAFETVLPHDEVDKKSATPPRPCPSLQLMIL